MALAKNFEQPEKAGLLVTYPVKAGAHIYKGALVCADTTGNAVPAADTANYRFLGIADEESDNTGGVSGAKKVRIKKTGTYVASASGWTAASIGAPLYATADDTVVASGATNNILVGYGIEAAGGGKVRFRIDGAVQ